MNTTHTFLKESFFVGTLLILVALFSGSGKAAAADLNLNDAVILSPFREGPVAKAAQMLSKEIEKRSGVALPVVATEPQSGPAIFLGTVENFPVENLTVPDGLQVPGKAEGYSIWTDASSPSRPRVFLLGRDERGALFAVGRLIRVLTLRAGQVHLDPATAIATAPAYPIRGHQLGYRETANSYDAWDLETFDQYIRDLILFGTNGIELITALRPGTYDGVVMTEPQWEMNLKLADLVRSYGLEVWFWMPVLGDVSDPEVAKTELEERRQFFEACPAIDDIFVPGGDPGSNPPKVLMPFLERMAKVLHASFPNAGIWVSNQKFGPEENDDLFDYLQARRPKWFSGVAFGPGTELPIRETRRRTPPEYGLRRYPDITHNVRCQYPVPQLDGIWAQTAGREAINPRPLATAHIHNVWADRSNGFCSYSDGIHDDLNKVVWSALAWDPETPVESILKDYGRVFFGPEVQDRIAEGLFGLEKNWEGPATANKAVPSTYRLWDEISKTQPRLNANWRFQMHLFRAAFDAYIQERARVEKEYEKRAYDCLEMGLEDGNIGEALGAARAALAQADINRPRRDLRLRIEDLGVALYGSIGFQLSTREPYRAKNPERGALLDKVDRALNDRPFLEAQFALIALEQDPDKQRARIDRLVNWEDPGEGGFYDDLGCGWKQPHLVRQVDWKTDPMSIEGPQEAHYRSMDNEDHTIAPLKFSWLDQAETDYGLPVLMRYENLDPNAQYRVRVTYFGRYGVPMRLVADETFPIHDLLGPSDPVWPVEFPVPKQATQDGSLDLAWNLETGRGCMVAEVWLIKRP